MNLRFEQLEEHLTQPLKPLYLVSGDEPLLVQEVCDRIRAAARQAGFSERDVQQVDAKYDWHALLDASHTLSLFAEKKIIELNLTSGKPGDQGSKALQAYCAEPAESNLLLIISPKIDKSTQNSKWYKALDSTGVHIAVWPVDHQQLPQWIARRMRKSGINADRDAIKLLADLVDGNLLAAAQEIEKLKLISNRENIDSECVRASVCDSSRFNIFNLVDTALKGDLAYTYKILTGLRAEGIEPGAIIWALSREIRQLAAMKQLMETGQSTQQAMRQYRVWNNRQNITGSALNRSSSNLLNGLIQALALADQMMKGMMPGNTWDQLEQVSLSLAGANLPCCSTGQ